MNEAHLRYTYYTYQPRFYTVFILLGYIIFRYFSVAFCVTDCLSLAYLARRGLPAERVVFSATVFSLYFIYFIFYKIYLAAQLLGK